MKSNKLREAIINATNDFPPPTVPDTNTIDILDVARNLLDFVDLPLPTNTPDKEMGIAIVECVEDQFVKGVLVRDLSQEEIIQRAEKLAKCLRTKGINADLLKTVTIALFTWHGCICMGKATRIVDSMGTLYNHDMRIRDYTSLKNDWEEEERLRNNLWVKYGVTLTRSLEKKRSNLPVEDWIEKDSPYWQNND